MLPKQNPYQGMLLEFYYVTKITLSTFPIIP